MHIRKPIYYLGAFTSMEEVWRAYPHGGHAGECLTVAGIAHFWDDMRRNWLAHDGYGGASYRLLHQTGDLHLDGDLRVGGQAVFQQPTVFKRDVRIEGALVCRHLHGRDRGLFSTVEALRRACPSPRLGEWALVGDTGQPQLWNCETEGVWTMVSDAIPLAQAFDLDAYRAARDIVDCIAAAGYVFCGVAEPSTNPHRPVDHNVFYLSSTPGEYVHFGGLHVQYLSVLMWTHNVDTDGNGVAEGQWSARVLLGGVFVHGENIADGAVTWEKTSGIRDEFFRLQDMIVTENTERQDADRDLQADVRTLQRSVVRSVSVNGGTKNRPDAAGNVDLHVVVDTSGAPADIEAILQRVEALEQLPDEWSDRIAAIEALLEDREFNLQDAVEIKGTPDEKEDGDPSRVCINGDTFAPGHSYFVTGHVYLSEDIDLPTGVTLAVIGCVHGNGHSLTGQSTKFNAPYQKVFDNVTVSGTWDCLAKPDWFGAKSDNENFGNWPLVFYGSTLSSTPTTSTDGPAVVNPNAFIDESLAMVAEVDAMSASPSAEVDQAKLALIGKVRPKHVVYCTDSQKFVLHYNNTYYSSWANSSLWNDAQTGKARTDTLFFCMNDVGGWPVADGPAGFTQIDAHRYSGDAHAPVAWTDGLSDGSLAFSKAVAMTKGRLSLKKDGTYYLATLRNINSNTLSYLELYNRDDVLIEGNGATLLFAPQVVNSVTPRRAVNVMKCKKAVIRDINFTSVCDKAGFAYGEDSRYQSGGYRLLNLAASNLLGVFQADCVETNFEDISIRKMCAFGLRQESSGQINKHTVIRRADIREAPNVIYVSELENLLVEDSYLETMPLNSPGGHIVYRAGGSPSGQTAHDVVVRGSVLKAPDATTNCLLHGNIPEYAGKTKLKLENCTLFCNRVWQGFGGNVLSLVDSNVKRTVRYQAGDKLASLTIPSLFTGAGSLYFRDSSIQSYVAGTVSDAPIHNMDDSYGISRRPGMVFHAVNTTFNTIATGYACKFNGDIYVDHCVLNGTNSTAFFRNLSPRNVVIRCSEAKVGQQLIEMQQCKGDCTIEDNMVTFSSNDACRLLSTAAATLHRHVVRSNALVAESSNVDVANVRKGGSVYSNTLNGTSGDLYSYDETDGLDDVKDTLFGGVQPDASGLLAERAGICPSTAGTVYYATDEGKYYQAVSEGTPCGVWISFTANGNTPDAAQGFNTVPVQGVVTMTTADGQLIARATLDSAADGKTFSTLQDIRKYVMDKFAENYSVDSSGIGSGGEGNRYGYVKVFSKGGLNAGATVSSWVLTTSALPGSATAGLKGITINKYTAKYAQGADATWEEIPSSGLVGQVAWLIEKVNELINA